MKGKALIADSLNSCLLQYVAFRKEQIADVACAALMDLN